MPICRNRKQAINDISNDFYYHLATVHISETKNG